MNKRTIAICGVAGAGKDSFANALVDFLNAEKDGHAKKYSLATPLKSYFRETIFKLSGIDPCLCSREQKELIRPLLVEFGKTIRSFSKGEFWVKQLFDEFYASPARVAVVPDVRYTSKISGFPKDELETFKETGPVIHLERRDKGGMKILPPNEDETINDPHLKLAADLQIQIYDVEDEVARLQYYSNLAKDAFNQLIAKGFV